MRNLVYIISALVLIVSCTSRTANKTTTNKPIVTVTILPQKFFVEQIAGDLIDVNVMVPPGASPADYEPTPKQVTRLSESVLYFYVGHLGFEKSWIGKLKETAQEVEFVPTSLGLDLIDAECLHEDGEENNHASGTDPHVWTSPENVKTMSKNIHQSLVKVFPEQQEYFAANLTKFISRIDSLDIGLRGKLNELENRTFLIYHPALGYFARDYHLDQVSIEFEGKSPSTAHVKEVIDLAAANNIATVFIQSQFESAKAKSIANEIGAEVVSIDPLNPDWLKEMKELGDKLTKALSK